MVIVDRIEGEYAVCETDTGMMKLPLSALPGGVREGDVLQKSESGWTVDEPLTAARREEALRRTRALFQRKRPPESK